MNPRNVIVDVFVQGNKGWDDESIRSLVKQGYTIYRMRANQLTISGRESFGTLAKTSPVVANSFFRVKLPYEKGVGKMITWLMMQVGGNFKILDTTHRKEICSDNS